MYKISKDTTMKKNGLNFATTLATAGHEWKKASFYHGTTGRLIPVETGMNGKRLLFIAFSD